MKTRTITKKNITIFLIGIIIMGITLACVKIKSAYLSSLYHILASRQLSTHPSRLSAHLQGWYPTDAYQLADLIRSLDNQAKNYFSASINPMHIRALMVPHAGYTYSGTVAAAAYRLLSPSIKRAMVLAPAHYSTFTGIALPTAAAYQTPLGTLSIDQTVLTQLQKNPLFTQNDHIYQTEHSLEIQLPFIQTYLPNASLVPLIVGTISKNQALDIATALDSCIDQQTIIIISSDFTHYGPSFNYTPFTNFIPQRITQLDSGALQAIQNHSLPDFISYIDQTQDTICGRYALAIFLALPEKTLEPHLIAYQTSAEITDNPSVNQVHNHNNYKSDNNYKSVSYISMVFTTPSVSSLPIIQPSSIELSGTNTLKTVFDPFTQYEKKALLAFSHALLHQSFIHQIPDQLLYPLLTKNNTAPRGAFVTLYKKAHNQNFHEKKLRGCIGTITSEQPLYKTIASMTRAAAFNDSRFEPVTIDELPDITISLSVLTEPKPIPSYHDIILGTHGIILTHNTIKGVKSALFLPKVATEFGWDLPTTLTELSKKAGLAPAAWQKPDTTYQVFESIDFSEQSDI